MNNQRVKEVINSGKDILRNMKIEVELTNIHGTQQRHSDQESLLFAKWAR